MSFVVSFKGQFQPYRLPTTEEFKKVHKTDQSQATHDVEEFKITGETKAQKPHIKSHIDYYQKVQKEKPKATLSSFAYEIMSSPVQTLDSEQTVAHAKDFMQKYHHRHYPIMQNNQLVGIVTHHDLLKVKSQDQKLASIMTPEVLTCFEKTRINDLARIMLYEKINSLPIISDQYQLKGIITQTDILKYLIGLFPFESLV